MRERRLSYMVVNSKDEKGKVIKIKKKKKMNVTGWKTLKNIQEQKVLNANSG